MTDGIVGAAWQNEAARRRVGQRHESGVPLRLGVFLVLVAVLFLGPFAGQAQAHGGHTGVTVQMPPNWAETTVSQDAAEAMSAQAGCGVNCCSATGCAAAVMSVANPTFVVVATDDRFSLPGQTPPKSSLQSTLKRPPRA